MKILIKASQDSWSSVKATILDVMDESSDNYIEDTECLDFIRDLEVSAAKEMSCKLDFSSCSIQAKGGHSYPQGDVLIYYNNELVSTFDYGGWEFDEYYRVKYSSSSSEYKSNFHRWLSENVAGIHDRAY